MRRIKPWSKGIKVALAILCPLYLLVACAAFLSKPDAYSVLFLATAMGLSAFSYAGYRYQRAHPDPKYLSRPES